MALNSEDQKTVDNIVSEAQEIIPNLESDDLEYLTSSSGLLRLYKSRGGKLFILGSSGDWLTEVAQAVASRINATVG